MKFRVTKSRHVYHSTAIYNVFVFSVGKRTGTLYSQSDCRWSDVMVVSSWRELFRIGEMKQSGSTKEFLASAESKHEVGWTH